MFTSYAQNFEDVMLWRALKHIDCGFYIDIGANDPVIDSVTKAFYDRGWSGINIEPITTHHADLQRQRGRDINLCCAAGAERGEINIWECEIRGWATAEPSVVEKHIGAGHVGAYHRVTMRTLADICEEYVTGEIHFLKIDVEGFEKTVLEGAAFQKFRPWIVVIEATRPNSTERVHEQWAGILTAAGYQLAYSDGLNQFYLAAEHPELASTLIYPPNVFDGFISAAQMSAETRAAQAEIQANRATARAEQAEAMATQAEQRLYAVLSSCSWRITAPLRWADRGVLRLASIPGKVTQGLKGRIKMLLRLV